MFGMITPAPISIYLGVNGSGKTLSAVAFAVRDQERKGRPLVTNVQGIQVDHVFFDDVEELPAILQRVSRRSGVGCNIVMDEVGAVFSSRESGRKKGFEKTAQQLRKFRSRLLMTAPTFARAEKIAREVTFDAILCSPMIRTHEKSSPWPSTRLIFQKVFDVSRLDNSGQQMHSKAKTKGFGMVRTARWQDAFDSFATAGISLVGDDDDDDGEPDVIAR